MVKEDISKNKGRGRPGTAFETNLHTVFPFGMLTVFAIIYVLQ